MANVICFATARVYMTALQAFEAYVKDMTTSMGRNIEDLEDVRSVMLVLKEVRQLCQNCQCTVSSEEYAKCIGAIIQCMQVREQEADLDAMIRPIEDMYSLLRRYDVKVPGEELDAVSDLRYSWHRLHDLASVTSDRLSHLQVPSLQLKVDVQQAPFASLKSWSRLNLRNRQLTVSKACLPPKERLRGISTILLSTRLCSCVNSCRQLHAGQVPHPAQAGGCCIC